MNNVAQKVTRIDKDAWDIATELANEYGVSICHIISESVRYCAENAEFKEIDVVVKRLVVGSKVLEQEGKMNEKKQNNDLIKEIIEKHFENMVDDILEHTETYYEALGAISSIKGSKIPNMLYLADCLRKDIRKRAMQQKTPNHDNQVLKDYAFERMCTT